MSRHELCSNAININQAEFVCFREPKLQFRPAGVFIGAQTVRNQPFHCPVDLTECYLCVQWEISFRSIFSKRGEGLGVINTTSLSLSLSLSLSRMMNVKKCKGVQNAGATNRPGSRHR